MGSTDIARDKSLFAEIAKGDGTAFKSLFDLYHDPLRANAFKVLKSEFWAEEVAQEVLARVWEKRQTLPDVEHPGGWLYRVCANECLQRLRKQQREIRHQYLVHAAQETDSTEQTPRYDTDLLQGLVKDAVALLPEQARRVYLLQQEEELTYQEIGDRLGISRHTVRNHLIRAYQTIRTHVQEHGEFTLLLPAVLPFF